jgi:hypothetical protein
MLQRKLPKRLFKNRDVIHTYQHERAGKTSLKRMTRDHLDLLQNIEFALVMCARSDSRIDDRSIDVALRSYADGTALPVAADDRMAQLRDCLESVRSLREDITDDIWDAGLRTVNESVRRHSDLKPGEKSYLRFVSAYVR